MNAIILLHGALASKEQMNPLAEILSASYEVHSIDFPGHGTKSHESGDFSIERMVDELESYILVNDIEHPLVFGYSMGGYVALVHALHRPEIISKIITLATKFDWTRENAEKETRTLHIETMKSKIPDFVNILKLRHGEYWETVILKTAKMMNELGQNRVLNELNLVKINTPTLLCVGDRDKMVNMQETENTAHLLKNGKVNILTDTSHPFEKVNYDKLAEIILNQ